VKLLEPRVAGNVCHSNQAHSIFNDMTVRKRNRYVLDTLPVQLVNMTALRMEAIMPVTLIRVVSCKFIALTVQAGAILGGDVMLDNRVAAILSGAIGLRSYSFRARAVLC